MGKPGLPAALQLLSLCSIYLSAVSGFSSLNISLAILLWTNPPGYVSVYNRVSLKGEAVPFPLEKICFERGSKLSVLSPLVLLVLWQILRCLIFISVQFFISHLERAHQHLRFKKIAFWFWESIYSPVHSSALHIFLNT